MPFSLAASSRRNRKLPVTLRGCAIVTVNAPAVSAAAALLATTPPVTLVDSTGYPASPVGTTGISTPSQDAALRSKSAGTMGARFSSTVLGAEVTARVSPCATARRSNISSGMASGQP